MAFGFVIVVKVKYLNMNAVQDNKAENNKEGGTSHLLVSLNEVLYKDPDSYLSFRRVAQCMLAAFADNDISEERARRTASS
jgi:hypothetical protein